MPRRNNRARQNKGSGKGGGAGFKSPKKPFRVTGRVVKLDGSIEFYTPRKR